MGSNVGLQDKSNGEAENHTKKMLRSKLGIKLKDIVRNKTILERTEATDVGCRSKKSKSKYAGHLARSACPRLHKLAAEWTPYGFTRSVWGAGIRWRGEIEKRVCTQ